MQGNYRVAKLDIQHVNLIATLHEGSFKNFFLTSLGKSFLKTFYKALLANTNGIGVGVFYDDTMLGFAIGTFNSSGFYKSLIKAHGLTLGLSALPALVLNPSKINRLAQSFIGGEKDTVKDALPSLLSICVNPHENAKGIGKLLLSEFEKILRDKGYKELTLTTDAENNDYVNNFYLRNNYNCIQTFFQGKRKMNLYNKKIK